MSQDNRTVYEPNSYIESLVTIFRSDPVRLFVNSGDDIFVENSHTGACIRVTVRGDGVFVTSEIGSALQVSTLNGIPSVSVLPQKLT